MFVDVSAKSAAIEVMIETFDHAHVARVVTALDAAGYPVQVDSFTTREFPPL
jgi:hypothetical protein